MITSMINKIKSINHMEMNPYREDYGGRIPLGSGLHYLNYDLEDGAFQTQIEGARFSLHDIKHFVLEKHEKRKYDPKSWFKPKYLNNIYLLSNLINDAYINNTYGVFDQLREGREEIYIYKEYDEVIGYADTIFGKIKCKKIIVIIAAYYRIVDRGIQLMSAYPII